MSIQRHPKSFYPKKVLQPETNVMKLLHYMMFIAFNSINTEIIARSISPK